MVCVDYDKLKDLLVFLIKRDKENKNWGTSNLIKFLSEYKSE